MLEFFCGPDSLKSLSFTHGLHSRNPAFNIWVCLFSGAPDKNGLLGKLGKLSGVWGRRRSEVHQLLSLSTLPEVQGYASRAGPVILKHRKSTCRNRKHGETIEFIHDCEMILSILLVMLPAWRALVFQGGWKLQLEIIQSWVCLHFIQFHPQKPGRSFKWLYMI